MCSRPTTRRKPMRDIEPRARNHLDIDAWARPHHPTSAAKPQRGPHKQALSLNTALVASVGGRGLRLPRRSDLIAQHKNRDPEHEHQPPEPWVTKRQLADHLSVTPRWIELQQPLGLPRISTGGMNRYRISEVEAWLRERYGSPSEASQPRNR